MISPFPTILRFPQTPSDNFLDDVIEAANRGLTLQVPETRIIADDLLQYYSRTSLAAVELLLNFNITTDPTDPATSQLWVKAGYDDERNFPTSLPSAHDLTVTAPDVQLETFDETNGLIWVVSLFTLRTPRSRPNQKVVTISESVNLSRHAGPTIFWYN